MAVTDQQIQDKRSEVAEKKMLVAQAQVSLVSAKGAENTATAELQALVAQKTYEDMQPQ